MQDVPSENSRCWLLGVSSDSRAPIDPAPPFSRVVEDFNKLLNHRFGRSGRMLLIERGGSRSSDRVSGAAALDGWPADTLDTPPTGASLPLVGSYNFERTRSVYIINQTDVREGEPVNGSPSNQ